MNIQSADLNSYLSNSAGNVVNMNTATLLILKIEHRSEPGIANEDIDISRKIFNAKMVAVVKR